MAMAWWGPAILHNTGLPGVCFTVTDYSGLVAFVEMCALLNAIHSSLMGGGRALGHNCCMLQLSSPLHMGVTKSSKRGVYSIKRHFLFAYTTSILKYLSLVCGKNVIIVYM